jgi:uncharacterized OB-fold protein
MTVTAKASALTTPPVPVPNALTSFFWDGVAAHELRILRCRSCGHHVHYPRPICDRCQSADLAPERVSGRATLYAYTWATQAFHPYFVDKVPYAIAVVELVEEPGLRLTTNIVDCPADLMRTGMDLEVVFDEVAPGLTLPLFRPADRRETEEKR